MISFQLSAYGKENSAGYLDCYVEAIKKVKKGAVETKCTQEAVVKGWSKLTQQDLDEVLGDQDIENILNNEEDGQTITFKETESKEKFTAK